MGTEMRHSAPVSEKNELLWLNTGNVPEFLLSQAGITDQMFFCTTAQVTVTTE